MSMDGVNKRVGIGTTSPDELLHIKSSSSYKPVIQIENTNTNAIPGYLKFYKNSTSPADDDYLGVLIFRGNTDNGSGAVSSSDVEFASIQVIADDTGNSSKSSKMLFKTFTSNTESTNMVIGKDGNVGINTEAPGALLDIAATSNDDYPLKIRGNIDNDGGFTGIKFGYEADTGNYEKCAIKVEGTSGNVQPDFHILLNNAASSADVWVSVVDTISE